MKKEAKQHPARATVAEARAERAKDDPSELLDTVIAVSKRITDCQKGIDEKVNHIKALCEFWVPEYFQDYLNTVYDICDIYDQIEHLARYGRNLRDLHSW